MKIRQDKDANYKAVFFEGKTVRFKIDQSKPFGNTLYPEIEDVAINNKCLANCSYCYTSATKHGFNFESIVEKAQEVWGGLSPEHRPFQIAIGGAGESTMHPDWVKFVRVVNELGIMPNYTTNGMHLTDGILEATERYCGGVALSWHPHIANVFHNAVERLRGIKTKINFHVIVGEENSLSDLQSLYDAYADIVSYFVILPYQAVGRGKVIESQSVWGRTFAWIKQVAQEKFAFGALFYDYLQNNNVDLKMSLYEPEVFSGYRIMDNTYKILRKSSYDTGPKIAGN